jgi:hypothetical protein
LSNIALETLLLRQALADMKDTLGDRGAGITLYNMLDDRLLSIAAATACACSSLNPKPPSSGCTGTAYTSSGTVVDEYGATGTMSIATFTSAGALLLSDGGQSLATGTSDWSGWSIYVTSTASQFAYRPGLSNRLPTKKWIDLSEYEDEMSFAVDAGSTLQVTLCGPSESACPEYDAHLLGEVGGSRYVATVSGHAYQLPYYYEQSQWISGRSFRVTEKTDDVYLDCFEAQTHALSLNVWYHVTWTWYEKWRFVSDSPFLIQICDTIRAGSTAVDYGAN